MVKEETDVEISGGKWSTLNVPAIRGVHLGLKNRFIELRSDIFCFACVTLSRIWYHQNVIVMFCFGSSERSVNHSGHLTLFPNSDLQPATCNLRPANYTLRISFIIYSALSTPFYFFAVRFVVDFECSQTHFSFWKWATAAIQDHILISFLIDVVAGDLNTCLYKYKNSFYSSKDRLDTKILSQFYKIQDKTFRWSFFIA